MIVARNSGDRSNGLIHWEHATGNIPGLSVSNTWGNVRP